MVVSQDVGSNPTVLSFLVKTRVLNLNPSNHIDVVVGESPTLTAPFGRPSWQDSVCDAFNELLSQTTMTYLGRPSGSMLQMKDNGPLIPRPNNCRAYEE